MRGASRRILTMRLAAQQSRSQHYDNARKIHRGFRPHRPRQGGSPDKQAEAPAQMDSLATLHQAEPVELGADKQVYRRPATTHNLPEEFLIKASGRSARAARGSIKQQEETGGGRLFFFPLAPFGFFLFLGHLYLQCDWRPGEWA
jgi:hypothetical protein